MTSDLDIETTPVAGTASHIKTAGPRTLAEARRAVEQSRERISATLNELEDRIVETKESIQRKADVVKPARDAIRRTPLIALGVGVVVGLLLGTRGGKDDEEDEDDEYGFDKHERKALEEWRQRRRRMLMSEAEDASVAFMNEDEIEELEESRGGISRFFRSIGSEVGAVALGIVAAEVAERMVGARSHDDDDDGDELDDGDDGDDPEYADDDDDLEIIVVDPEADAFDETASDDDDYDY